MRQVSKRYSGVLALDHVDLSIERGTVHALVGENGAGKSTLIKILAGVIHADGGEILMDDSPVRISTPHAARTCGIEVVHQHTNLIQDLSLAENFALRRGYPRRATGPIAWRRLAQQATNAARLLIPSIDVSRAARTLTGVEQQMAEISFALAARPRLLILDEPTALLPLQEKNLLFKRIREAVAEGTSVLFVSHRLEEVFELTQRVTVLRDGAVVWHKPTADTNHDDLVRGMVGRQVTFARDESCVPQEAISLQVKSLTDSRGGYQDVSFDLHKGEIYGIYGLVGAGQSPLCHSIFGLTPERSGSVTLSDTGRDINKLSPKARVQEGLAYVPADRLKQGMLYQMSVRENISLACLERFSFAGLLNQKAEAAAADVQVQSLRTKTSGLNQNVSELSGGNQQKVLLGRWLLTNPAVLVLEEPTQGVDVAAKGEIHKIITGLAKEGVAILLISSELPEIMSLAHRIGIMNQGRIVSEVDPTATSEEDILKLALPASSKADESVAGHGATSRRSAVARAAGWILAKRESSLALFIVLISLIFGLTVPAFATVDNATDILVNNTILLIGALGITLVIISGGIDVSVGSILALAAVMAAKADLGGHSSLYIAAIALSSGLILGVFNGTLSVVGRVHPIIITLGTMSIFRGAMLKIAAGEQMFNLSSNLTVFGQTSFGDISVLLLVGVGVLIVTHCFLQYTVAGRRFYAYGGNKDSATVLGIKAIHVMPLAFGLCGLLVGLAALLYAGRYGQVQAFVGVGYELKVIAAAVIGGTHIMGGRGSALGTFLGAILIGIVSNVMVLAHISSFWEGVVMGAMILLAMAVDNLGTRRRSAEVLL